MKKNIVIIILLIIPLFAITFQNCSTTNFKNQTSSDGLDSAEPASGQCKEVQTLSIWSISKSTQLKDKLLGDITAYNGKLSAAQNYNYSNSSEEILVGPKPNSFSSHIFFYNSPEGLTFNFFHNIISGTSYVNSVAWDVKVIDNNFTDQLLLSDDPNEIVTSSRSPSSTLYKAYSNFKEKSDGGIIGPLRNRDFKIKISAASGQKELSNTTFHSSDGRQFDLKRHVGIKEFLITYSENRKCN